MASSAVDMRIQALLPRGKLRQHRIMLLVAAVWLTPLLVYFETSLSLWQLWNESGSYSHGVLVLPIALFFVFRQGVHWQDLQLDNLFSGYVALLIAVSIWFLGQLGGLQVVAQLGLLLCLWAMSWCLLGRVVFQRLLFPVLFLVFAVPVGDFLIPDLMRLTAWSAVALLKLAGMPVHVDGLHISVPGGEFEIAKACSGIRYLMATVCFAVLYAELMMSGWRRCALFVAVAVSLALVANTLRAFGIILLAYYSGFRVAVGFDHLIYGWLFFSVIVALILVIGHYAFATKTAVPPVQATRVDSPQLVTVRQMLLAGAIAFFILLVGRLLPVFIPAVTNAPVALMQAQRDWQPGSLAEVLWHPDYWPANAEATAHYRKPGASSVMLHVRRYSDMDADHELISAHNRLADGDVWQLVNEKTVALTLNNGSVIELQQAQLRGLGQDVLVWYWFDINGQISHATVPAKLTTLWQRMTSNYQGSSFVSVATLVNAQANERLQNFLLVHFDGLHDCLYSSATDCHAGHIHE